MTTAYIYHPDYLLHDTGRGHPERAQRLVAIEQFLQASGLFDQVTKHLAIAATHDQLKAVHTEQHLAYLTSASPDASAYHIDPDTVMSPASLNTAKLAAGAVTTAVDLILKGDASNAFCAVRPPGHHAESSRAMGFCLFNNIAVGAAHALSYPEIERLAILDFDVHQGNGTEQITQGNSAIMFCSTFQHPFYPFSRLVTNDPNNVSVPLDAGDSSAEFRTAIREHWLPALVRFKPQMIFISAGFDAHKEDFISQTELVDEDYRWVTEQISQFAETHCDGRVISSLEGGYDLNSLSRSVAKHLKVLVDYSN